MFSAVGHICGILSIQSLDEYLTELDERMTMLAGCGGREKDGGGISHRVVNENNMKVKVLSYCT